MAKTTDDAPVFSETDADSYQADAAGDPDDDFAAGMETAARGGGLGGGGLAAALEGFDLSAAAENPTVPADTQVLAKIKVSEYKTSKAGNPMVAMQLEVLEPEEYKGIKFRDQVVIMRETMWKFGELIRATDLASADGKTFVGSGAGAFVGKDVAVVVIEEVYEGKRRNKLKGGFQAPEQFGSSGSGSGDAPRF